VSHFAYVLWSESLRKFYIGSTEDLDKRLRQHNEGLEKWSRRGVPWTLKFSKSFPNRSEARQFENKLKKQKGGKGFFKYTGLDPNDFCRQDKGS